MRDINYSIPRTRLFFNNYLPGAVMQHRNGMYGYVVGTNSNDDRVKTINRDLLKEVISEQLQLWRNMGGEVDANLETAVENNTLAIRAPDSIAIRPTPLMLECTRCHLIQQNRGREAEVINRLSSIARGDNPDLFCPVCRGRLKQVRFMRIHRCGLLGPIAPPPQHMGKRLKLIDGGTFYTTYWVDYDSNQNYGNLFATTCEHCKNSGLDMGTTRGAAIRDGRSETFYPRLIQYLSMTRETTELLEDALSQPEGDIEVGKAVICAFFGLQEQTAIRNNLRSMTEGNVDRSDLASLIADREKYINQRDSLKQLDGMEEMVKLAEEKITILDTQIDQAEGLFTVVNQFITNTALIRELSANRRSREAALFPGEFDTLTLEELREGESNSDQRAMIRENIRILREQRAVRSISYVKDASVVLASLGFSRELDNPVNSPNEIPVRLNAYIDEVTQSLVGKTPVYVLPANTEALHVRLDPIAVLRWAITNLGWVIEDDSVLSNEQRAHTFILQAAPMLTRTPSVAYSEAKLANDTNSLNMLGLIHTIAHLLMRSAKQGSGYDENSLMEYLFPADLSFLIYVTSTTDYTTGGLMSLFKHGLPDWFDIANLDALNCLYDPLCGQTGGSCHGCTQKAIGCETFNHGLSRAYIHGGTLLYPNGQTQEIAQGLWDD